ncbi:MAG: ABC transporter permease subunit, partial [Niameybacter sp.]
GLASTSGGMEEIMNALPLPLQAFFGSVSDAGTSIGTYKMIHLYLAIALSLHAILLGADIFSKEEHDRTYEFLYIKGVTRVKILLFKIVAGMALLLVLDVVCLIGIMVSGAFVGYSMQVMELLPYLSALFVAQLLFFSIALLLSFLLPDNHKTGMVGCCIVFVMLMLSMYVKMGGVIGFLEEWSIFHYLDASYIASHQSEILPFLLLIVLAAIGFVLSEVFHQRRDLL